MVRAEPPTSWLASTRQTDHPASANRNAAANPLGPPPVTTASNSPMAFRYPAARGTSADQSPEREGPGSIRPAPPSSCPSTRGRGAGPGPPPGVFIPVPRAHRRPMGWSKHSSGSRAAVRPPATGGTMAFQITEVQKALKGVNYPATNNELANHAEGNGADRELVDALRGMNKSSFDGPNAVMKELKGSLTGSND